MVFVRTHGGDFIHRFRCQTRDGTTMLRNVNYFWIFVDLSTSSRTASRVSAATKNPLG